MSTISPQGYNITDAPFNSNPFWEATIEGSIQSLSMTKRTEGDFDYYTWKYVDVDGEEHVFAEQRVSNKAGENGVTYTPNVSPDGTLTWSNDGGLSNPSPVNILGPRGETGESATIRVGDVTTLEANNYATVRNVGTENNAIFSFGIPKGNDGNPGRAATIEIGAVMTIEADQPVSVTNSGTENDAIFNFGIPKGQTGPVGEAATVSVGSVTTLEADQPATVTNSGTENTAIFNFGIPKGRDGSAGAAATVSVGSVTALEADQPPTVINSGTENAAIFNFGIPKGQTGSVGEAATVSVGSVTTLEANQPATVTNSGTENDAIFNFGIPKGPKGDTALTLTIGSVTEGDTPSVTNGGTDTDIILNFVLPKGAVGAAGAAATVSVGTVTTLEAGQPATVTNSGTDNAAIFNFGIPRGEAGGGGGLYAYTYAELEAMDKITWDSNNRELSINDKNFILGNLGVSYSCSETEVYETIFSASSYFNVSLNRREHDFKGDVIVSPGKRTSKFINIESGDSYVYVDKVSSGYVITFPNTGSISQSGRYQPSGSFEFDKCYYAYYIPGGNVDISIDDNSMFYFTSPLS